MEEHVTNVTTSGQNGQDKGEDDKTQLLEKRCFFTCEQLKFPSLVILVSLTLILAIASLSLLHNTRLGASEEKHGRQASLQSSPDGGKKFIHIPQCCI